MKLALLSNINIDPIGRIIKNEFGYEVYISGYDQCSQELLNPLSAINTQKFDFVLIILDSEELLRKEKFLSEVGYPEILQEMMNLIRDAIQRNENTVFIVSKMAMIPFSFKNYNDSISPDTINSHIASFNKTLIEFVATKTNMLSIDLQRLVLLMGYYNFTDPKYWYLGRIKYTNAAFKVIAKDLKNLLNAYQGKSKKVLILDLDNTLWGGVVGEDGVNGILLSDDGKGKIYKDFQRIIKSLKDLGILLAICSKNNETDVIEVFKNHDMILKEEDFILKKINWLTKAENIKEISNTLSLGLDSFVFIDDNPIERELVKKYLPEVEVPVFPNDITTLCNWFYSDVVYEFFGKVKITQEDKNKNIQYERNIKRSILNNAINIEDYIKSLEIKLQLLINDQSTIARISQLTQKTNQFNLTTKRYSEIDIRNFIQDPTFIIFGLKYEDKFGEEGIIAAAIIKLNNNTACIDTFLMSCRVIGRNVEFKFLLSIIDTLNKANIERLEGEIIPSPKNIVAQDFYSNSGFQQLSLSKYFSNIYDLEQHLKSKYSY